MKRSLQHAILNPEFDGITPLLKLRAVKTMLIAYIRSQIKMRWMP